MAGQAAAKAHWQNNWQRSWDMCILTAAPCTGPLHLYFLRNHIDWTDKKEVQEALKDINLEFPF